MTPYFHSLQSPRAAAVGLVIGAVLFGLGSLIVVHIPVGGYAIAFWRLAVASVVFWLLARRFGQKLPAGRTAVRYALLSGVFLGFDLALWHESIYAVGPGIATLLNSLQIFWLSAIGFFWFQERLGRLQIVSLLMATAGVMLIASPEFGHNQAAWWGVISGLVSGLMLALSMVYVRKTQQSAPTQVFPLMLLMAVGGMAALVLPSLWFDSGRLFPTTAAQIGWILVYGIVMQCLAWGLIAYAIPLLSLSLTGLLLLSEPVAALLIDYALLDKSINAWQWSGALLTMTAIYLGSLKNKNH